MNRTAEWEDWRQLSPEEAIPDVTVGHWWVAHTKPRHEKALFHELGRMEITRYLPLRTRTACGGRGKRRFESVVPVFPGYLFFSGTEEQRYRALRTHRIAQTIQVSDQQRLVTELRGLHRLLGSGGAFTIHRRLQPGQWVRVTAGPLEGTEGVVARRLSRLRLALNVHMLGQSISLQIEEELLEPIEAPEYLRVRA